MEHPKLNQGRGQAFTICLFVLPKQCSFVLPKQFLSFFCQIPLRSDRDLKVSLSVFDSNGNEFDDASSLVIDWAVDRTDIGSFVNKDTQYEQNGGKTKSKYFL